VLWRLVGCVDCETFGLVLALGGFDSGIFGEKETELLLGRGDFFALFEMCQAEGK